MDFYYLPSLLRLIDLNFIAYLSMHVCAHFSLINLRFCTLTFEIILLKIKEIFLLLLLNRCVSA